MVDKVIVSRFKTLLAIAELGTFAEAAAAVHLTPAAVSQQMKALEVELGITLFDRTKRPPELYPVAYTLIPKARELVTMYEGLKPSLSRARSPIQRLTIGAVPTTMTGLMPRALKGLKEGNENLHIRLYPGLSEELYAQVDRGFLDAAILTEPATLYEHLYFKPFVAEPLVVLASTKVKASNPKKVLESNSYIRFSRRAWVGRTIDDWLLANDIQVNETMELDTLEAIAAMVQQNLGVSIVPLNSGAIPEPAGVRTIPLGDSAQPRVLGVLSRHDSNKDPVVELLWSVLLRIVTQAGRGEAMPKP